MKKKSSFLGGAIVSGLIAVLLLPSTSVQAIAPRASACVQFKETGFGLCGRFLTYWREHGGLAQQGFPISGEFQEVSVVDGKTYTVQYFERAVFELHPEKAAPYDVLLSLLGSIQYKERYPNGAPEMPAPANPVAGRFFKETGKELREPFLSYWDKHGGLAQQGFPISNLVREKSLLDGKEYTVQYFERAVFELHPELAAPYNVLLSQLGTFQLRKRYPNGPPAGTPPPGTTLLGQGNWGGEHVNLTIDSSGKSYFEFDCAHGTISTPIALDGTGAFNVTGVYVQEHGGPARVDETADSHPAKYSGTVSGSTMTLNITVTDMNLSIPNLTLTLGKPGIVHKCL